MHFPLTTQVTVHIRYNILRMQEDTTCVLVGIGSYAVDAIFLNRWAGRVWISKRWEAAKSRWRWTCTSPIKAQSLWKWRIDRTPRDVINCFDKRKLITSRKLMKQLNHQRVVVIRLSCQVSWERRAKVTMNFLNVDLLRIRQRNNKFKLYYLK